MKKSRSEIVSLAELVDGQTLLFGIELGRTVFQKLQQRITPTAEPTAFGISLAGIQATDASFPRESVVALAKLLSGEVGIFLKDFASDAVIDNWAYAANAKNQPLIVIQPHGYQVIGPVLSDGSKELLDFIMEVGVVTTSLIAKTFDLSAQNASAKLKKLHQLGLILGKKAVAETGGLEYIYQAIR